MSGHAFRIFWDVDTQVDFMVPEGKLYVPGAVEITANLERLTRLAADRGVLRVASVCDHVLEDREISDTPDFATTFPPHCLRGTEGQRKIAATAMTAPWVIPNRSVVADKLRRRAAMRPLEVLIEKSEFDVFTNPNTAALLEALDPGEIVVYGVATDVCDAHAIAGFLERGRKVAFVEDAARAIHAQRTTTLFEEWRAKGVRFLTTEAVATELTR